MLLSLETEKFNFKVGDRVIWLTNGGYTEYTTVPAAKTLKLTNNLSFEDATAALISGLTVLALVKETYAVQPEDWVLLYAAAGGAGFLITQLLTHLGAKVINTAGGLEKVALVKSLGADYFINYRSEEGKD